MQSGPIIFNQLDLKAFSKTRFPLIGSVGAYAYNHQVQKLYTMAKTTVEDETINVTQRNIS